MRERRLDRCVSVAVLLSLTLGVAGLAQAAPRSAVRIEKVRALMMQFDNSGRQVIYRQARVDTTVRVAEAALPKFAALKQGDTVQIELERQDDGSTVAVDVRKPRNLGSYVAFVFSALFVLFVPAG